MNSSDNIPNRAWQWIRWILFSEGLILLWALAGPGYRYALDKHGDHSLLARLVMEEPSYLVAVLVNVVAMHIFVIVAWFAAWIAKKG